MSWLLFCSSCCCCCCCCFSTRILFIFHRCSKTCPALSFHQLISSTCPTFISYSIFNPRKNWFSTKSAHFWLFKVSFVVVVLAKKIIKTEHCFVFFIYFFSLLLLSVKRSFKRWNTTKCLSWMFFLSCLEDLSIWKKVLPTYQEIN